MGGSAPSSQVTGYAPTMLPPNYAYNKDFYDYILPRWTNFHMPNFQQAGGVMGRAPSPTQQAATHMMQQWATGPLNNEYNAFTQGVLGNLYANGGGINQWHSPTSADNALNRFLDPSFINPSASSGAPWADAFNLGGGGGPYGGGPWYGIGGGGGGGGGGGFGGYEPGPGGGGIGPAFYFPMMFKGNRPGPMTGGGPGSGTGLFTPPGGGQPNGRGGQG